MLVTKPELFGFLICYEFLKLSGGDTSSWTDLKALAESIDIKGHDFDLAIYFLTRKKLIKPYGAGYTYFLSDYAVDEVTKALKFPERPTDSFAPFEDIKAVVKTNGKNISLL